VATPGTSYAVSSIRNLRKTRLACAPEVGLGIEGAQGAFEQRSGNSELSFGPSVFRQGGCR